MKKLMWLFLPGLLAAGCASNDTKDSTKKTGLAGLYEGTLPCADCGGIETRLQLKPDSTFILLSTYTGTPDGKTETWPDIGTWSVASKETLVLEGHHQDNDSWLITHNGASLEKLSPEGREINSTLNYSLQRSTADYSGDLLPTPDTLTGFYQLRSDTGLFRPCGSERSWPVAFMEAGDTLLTAYNEGDFKDTPVYLEGEGYRWIQGTPQSEEAESCFVITRVIELTAGKSCN